MKCPLFLQIHGDELSSGGSLQNIHKLGSFSCKAVSELESIPLCVHLPCSSIYLLLHAEGIISRQQFSNYNSSCLVYECLSAKAKLYDAAVEYFQ